MKKFILAAVAATLVASPVMAAAPQNHGRQITQKVVVKKVSYRDHWRKGERFDSHKARNYRQIDYRKYRGLKAPPRGYRYVQSGNDAVLVGITSGIVAAVFANLIR